ncbi:FAD binding domain-containing protein [Sarocladium implicatum]|nr:FAD binding domain-containing protein [Sarocladium implicatum]
MTFRAIIIGGGPAGMAMARSLELAGIDYVVLEKHHEIAPNMGFQIALFPASVRLLDQFGLLEEWRRQSWEYHTKHNYSPSGTETAVSGMPGLHKEMQVSAMYGHPWMFSARRRLVQMLYESIPDRDTRVRTGMDVTRINIHDAGVEVICGDGTVEKGSIVIGCDGVRSITRSEMDRIEREETGRATNPPKPFQIPFRGFVGRANIFEGVEPGHVYETRGKGHSYQVLPSPMGLWFIQYAKTGNGHVEKRYTLEDADEVIKSTRNDVVTPSGLTFGEAWDAKIEGGLWDLHEGSVKKWHHGGRLVLVGDSCHKFTPTASSSLNVGWQGVVELANILRAGLLKNPDPDSAALDDMLKLYQSRRSSPAKFAELFSWLYPRIISWQNIFFRVLEYISPYTGGDVALFKFYAKNSEAKTIVLDYVEETDLPPGTRKWAQPPLKVHKADEDARSSEQAEVATS